MPLKPILTQESKMKRNIALVTIVIVVAVLFLNRGQVLSLVQKPTESPVQSTPPIQDNSLRVIATKPDPLEEATIPPDGGFEVTFNKLVDELKIKTSPEDLEYEAKIVKEEENLHTFRISFKKPLELGSGVTFYILANTHTKAGENLDKEYIYHIKTVGYTGV